MALTESERARLRLLWRQFADKALAAADNVGRTPELKPVALDALEWRSPLDAPSDAFVLFALARLSAGFVRAKVVDLDARRPSLLHLAKLVLDVLEREDPRPDPPPMPAPPGLPFRRDIDG